MPRIRDDFAFGTPLGPQWLYGDQWEPHDVSGWYGWVWPKVSDGEAIALWDRANVRGRHAAAVETLVYRFGGGGVVIGAQRDLSSYYILAYRSTARTTDREEPWHMRLSLEKVVGGNTAVLWQTEEDTPPTYPYLNFNRQDLLLTLAGSTLSFEYDTMHGRQGVRVMDSPPLTGRYSGMYARVATRPPYPKLGGWINWFEIRSWRSSVVHRVIDGNTGLRFAATTHEPASDTVPIEENDYNALLVGDDEPVTVVDDDVIVIGVEHAVESPWWKRLYFGNPWQRNAASLWSTLAQSS